MPQYAQGINNMSVFEQLVHGEQNAEFSAFKSQTALHVSEVSSRIGPSQLSSIELP